MKPFNLEEAKKGKPVVDSQGHKVEILKYDLKTPYENRVAGIVTYEDGNQCIGTWGPQQLFMATTKVTKWVCIARDEHTKNLIAGMYIFDECGEAEKYLPGFRHPVCVSKVEIEE